MFFFWETAPKGSQEFRWVWRRCALIGQRLLASLGPVRLKWRWAGVDWLTRNFVQSRRCFSVSPSAVPSANDVVLRAGGLHNQTGDNAGIEVP